MEIRTTTKVRSFDFLGMSEAEALALYSLVNLNDEQLRMKMMGDRSHWDNDMEIFEAIETAKRVRDSIIRAVDGPS